MRRFGLLSAVTVVLLAIPGSVALACNPPTIGVSQNAVGPDDPVYFNITDVTDGAEYAVKAGNQIVRTGRVTGTSVSDSFPMPDMGASATRVSVEVIVQHGDIENPDQTWDRPAAESIRYAGYATPAPGPQQTSSSSPAESPAAAPPVESAPQRQEPVTAAPPTAPFQGGPTGHAPRPSGGDRTSVAQPQRRQGRQAAPAKRRSAVRPTVTTGARPAVTPAVAPVLQAPIAQPRAGHTGLRHRRAAATVATVRPEVATMAPLPSVQQSTGEPVGTTVATRDLVLLAIASVLLIALLDRRRRGWGRGRGVLGPGPKPPDDSDARLRDLEIEAELQEILAEERARRDRAGSGVP